MKISALKQRGHMAGVTLVELLVAMVIGLFLLAGIVTVMVGTKQKFLVEQELSYIQENARFVVDELTREIRMAGYFGCGSQAKIANAVNTAQLDDSWMFKARGIFGASVGGTLPAEIPADVLAGTDVVIINRAEPDDVVKISTHAPGSATMVLNQLPSFSAGQIMVATTPSCDNLAIFQAMGLTTTLPATLTYSGASPSPGNCATELSGDYDCGAPPGGAGTPYADGSGILAFQSNAYYLRESPTTGQPALFKQSLGMAGSAVGSNQVMELASGVEDMDIIYGVDTTATNADGVVDRYFTASQITLDAATAGSDWVGWDRVVAARITLIMRSTRPVFNENTVVNLGETYEFNDRFMRQKVTSTVRLRNRGI